MTQTPPDAPKGAKPSRAQRILAALIGGAGPDAIGQREKLPVKRVESLVRDALARRWVAPATAFAKLQIARLETLALQALDRGQQGELDALDRALKILDRLDRYHGFHRANPTFEPYGDEERERLINKLNVIAARLEDDKPAT